MIGLNTGIMPYKILAKLLLPAISRAFLRIQDAEAARSLAILGCAFERHRIKHSSYPRSLESLDPSFLPNAVVDPFTGKNLLFTKRPDGSSLIYSVGPDLKDNGGEPMAAPSESKSENKGKGGDLIWLLPTN